MNCPYSCIEWRVTGCVPPLQHHLYVHVLFLLLSRRFLASLRYEKEILLSSVLPLNVYLMCENFNPTCVCIFFFSHVFEEQVYFTPYCVFSCVESCLFFVLFSSSLSETWHYTLLVCQFGETRLKYKSNRRVRILVVVFPFVDCCGRRCYEKRRKTLNVDPGLLNFVSPSARCGDGVGRMK